MIHRVHGHTARLYTATYLSRFPMAAIASTAACIARSVLPTCITEGWLSLVHRLAKVLTTGLLPDHLDAPALPAFLFLCCGLDRAPTVALQLASTRLCVPEGSLTTA